MTKKHYFSIMSRKDGAFIIGPLKSLEHPCLNGWLGRKAYCTFADAYDQCTDDQAFWEHYQEKGEWDKPQWAEFA